MRETKIEGKTKNKGGRKSEIKGGAEGGETEYGEKKGRKGDR